MPARRTTTAEKKLKGTYQACRENKSVPVSTGELGSAPDYMTDQEKAIWSEISAKLPEGVGTAADSLAFEVLVKLMSKFRSESLTGTETTLLLRSLSKFGATPQDRGTVSVPPVKGHNKFADI